MRHRNKIATGAAAAALLVTATVALAEPHREASLSAGGSGFGWDSVPITGHTLFADIGSNIPCTAESECDDTLVRVSGKGQLNIQVTDADAPEGQDVDLFLYESDESGEPGDELKSSLEAGSEESITHETEGGTFLIRLIAMNADEATVQGQVAHALIVPPDEDRTPPNFGPDPAPDPGGGTGGGGTGTGGGGTGGGGTQQPGTRVTPAATNAAPSSRVRRPARRSRRLSGTANDPDGTVRYVDVALVRLRADNRCRALTPRGTWRRIRKCSAPPFLRARGRDAWRVTMKRKLRPGRYALYSRAVDNVGKPEGGFGKGNLLVFRVR